MYGYYGAKREKCLGEVGGCYHWPNKVQGTLSLALRLF